MNTLTDIERAANAIKWIDALPEYRKTAHVLRNGDRPSNYSYCCLGVGAKVCKSGDDLKRGTVAPLLADLVGIQDECGLFKDGREFHELGALTDLNDILYKDDKDFTRMRKFILRHLSSIFDSGVSKILKAHYKAQK